MGEGDGAGQRSKGEEKGEKRRGEKVDQGQRAPDHKGKGKGEDRYLGSGQDRQREARERHIPIHSIMATSVWTAGKTREGWDTYS